MIVPFVLWLKTCWRWMIVSLALQRRKIGNVHNFVFFIHCLLFSSLKYIKSKNVYKNKFIAACPTKLDWIFLWIVLITITHFLRNEALISFLNTLSSSYELKWGNFLNPNSYISTWLELISKAYCTFKKISKNRLNVTKIQTLN